jgi:hypothetical protein
MIFSRRKIIERPATRSANTRGARRIVGFTTIFHPQNHITSAWIAIRIETVAQNHE